MANKNVVLILERSNTNLQIDKQSGDYVLEGIFAQFGVENNNKRIYEEKEYLPHLEYLKKKIGENRLMGELDHPEKFEISLQKVSHIIEKLEYDKEKRQVIGRIRLLDTPSGKIAKNLVDSGVPVSISSRAAGSVSENKSVSIKRIFTYDLVADPGFENAQLERINESLGLSEDDNIQVFSVKGNGWDFEGETSESLKTSTIAENLVGLHKDSTDITLRDITQSFLKKNITESVYINKINEHIKTMSTQNQNDSQNFVTVDALNRYSVHISNEIKNITEKLSTITESVQSKEIEDLKEEIDQLKRYSTYLAEESNNTRKYTDYVREAVVENLNETNELLENLSQYTETEIREKVNYLAEWTNEEIAKKLNYLAEYTDHLAAYTETEVGHKVNELARYTNTEIREGLEGIIGYTDEHIRENMDAIIGYNEYLKEQVQINRGYADYIAESAISKEDATKLFESQLNESNVSEKSCPKTEEEKMEEEKLKAEAEEAVEKDVNEKLNAVKTVDQKIDILLEEIKKEKIAETSKFPFIKKFGESNRARFNELNETKKEKVKKAILGTDYPALNEAQLVNVWETALVENVEVPVWLERAPEKYKKIYENLTTAGQQKISTAAKWYEQKLVSDYQIKSFWETRGLDEQAIQLENLPHLNESKKEEKTVTDAKAVNHKMGYNSDYVSRIAKSLERF